MKLEHEVERMSPMGFRHRIKLTAPTGEVITGKWATYMSIARLENWFAVTQYYDDVFPINTVLEFGEVELTQ